ncbi:MAG TPA: Ig-like domain-containing protein [Urbifossiella sp.]|nr:Ig-like domain-containing protein [Urbifossiella sp.]
MSRSPLWWRRCGRSPFTAIFRRAELRLEGLEGRDVPASFLPGDLVIYRVGDGTNPLDNNGSAIFLDEYTPGGQLVQSVPLPTSANGANNPIIASGIATTEGFLTLSADGRYLLTTGYDATLGGSTALPSSSAAAIPRAVARIAADGTVDTSTALTNYASTGDPRGVASTDGSSLWLTGSKGGLVFATLGATTSTSVNSSEANLREVAIFDGQLYVSTNFDTSFRIGAVGTGLPTDSGEPIASLPGLPTTTGRPNAFFLTHLDSDPEVPGVNTLYIADDQAGAVQKYTFDGSTWAASGTLAAAGVSGLTGTVDGPNVILYGTAGGGTSAGGGSLYTFTDQSGYGGVLAGTATTIATAANDEAFRGIAFTPQLQTAVVNVTSTTPNGPYSASSNIDVSVQFNSPVVVDTGDGSPQLALNTGGAGELAAYTGGSGTDTLHFTYTVSSGDTSPDLDYLSFNALQLDGATIQSQSTGGAASLTLPPPGAAGSLSANANIVVDTTPPTVLSSLRADPNPTTDSVVHFQVTFSEPVNLPSISDFSLTTSAIDGAKVTDVSGSADTYTVTVATGTVVPDSSTAGAISLNVIDNNDILDAAGNPLGGPTLGDGSYSQGESYSIPPPIPTVDSVTSSPSTAAYKAGDAVAVTVQFSGIIDVSGTPELLLATGAVPGEAAYIGGSGTDTLTFQYVVQGGDASDDLDYTNANALRLNGGTIRDPFGDDAVAVLPSPGDAGSLGANADIVIDTNAPAAPIITLTNDSGLSATDGITNDGSLSISGVEPTAQVQFSVDGGNTWQGSFSAVEGLNTVLARQTDEAGNVSANSAALTFTLDTVANAPSLTLMNDSGSSNVDSITNDGALSLTGVEGGAAVQYSTDNGANWTPTLTPLEGTNNVSVRQIDVAGNISIGSDTFTFVLDSTPPAALTIALSNDTGLSNIDLITSDGSLAAGNLETGSFLQFSTDGGTTWLSSFSAVEGLNTVAVRQIDAAGNISVISSPLSFTLDITSPSAPGVALTDDSGQSSSDFITNDAALALSDVEPGALVEYSTDDGATWSAGFAATAGSNTVEVRQTDVAGNISEPSLPLTFTLETSAAAPTIALANDTGSSDSDSITSDPTLTLVGVEPSATVEYSTDADAGASWSATYTAAEGANSVEARQTDIAGNVSSASTPLAFTLDTTPPAVLAVTLAHDTGISASDGITSDGSLASSGEEPDAIVQYSTDNGKSWGTTFAPEEGSNSVEVRQVDIAGNAGAATSVSFTLDTAAPTAPGLKLSNDTGSSATDRITSEGSIESSGIEPNATVEFSADVGKTWSSSFTAQEGSSSVVARQTDIAGNVSGASTLLVFTFDTSVAAPAIALQADTGSSNSDGITRNGKLTVSSLEAGAAAQYSNDGGMTWMATFTPVEGSNSIEARQIDLAGNVSAPSAPLSFTLDTIAPDAPGIALTNDTGSSGIDSITSVPSLTLSGVETGAALQYSVDGGDNWAANFAPVEGANTVLVRQVDIAGNTSASSTPFTFVLDTALPVAPRIALANDTGGSAADRITNDGTVALASVETGAIVQYSIDGGATWLANFAPVEGANSVMVRQTDVAGNIGPASSVLTFTLDTTLPIAPLLALANDTGNSANDSITSNGAVDVGAVEDGAVVQFSTDGGATWIASFTATEGANRVSARQTDVAGNVGPTSPLLVFTLDTTAPTAPTIALAHDTGASGNDRLTNDGSLHLGNIEIDAIVQFSVDNGNSWNSDFLPTEGVKSVRVRQVDVAGNIGAASPSLTFTLDTVAVPPTITLTNDTGSSSTDDITSIGSLTLSGVEAGASVEYSIDGGNTWSPNFTAAEGNNSVQARQTDAAGNVSAASAALTFTLKTIAPDVSAPALDSGSDSGASDSDGITNVVTPVIAGTAEVGAIIQLFGGGQVLGSATATDGTWSITSKPLSDGPHVLFVKATDAAGNMANSTSLTFTIDTAGPSVSVNRAGSASFVASDPNLSLGFVLNLSQAVASLDATDISVVGTAGGTISNVSGSGRIYSVTVAGVNQPGTVSLSISAGAGTDLAGNPSLASESGESVAVEFATRTQLLVSPAGLKAGDTVGAAANVVAPAGTTPAGSVLFTLTGPNGSVNDAAIVVNGKASASFASLPAGSYSLSADYQPDGGYVASTASGAFAVASPIPVSQSSIGQYVAAAGTTVTEYDANGNALTSFEPFGISESPGGIRVAEADITGDGVPDIVAVTGPGVPAQLRAFDGRTQQPVYTEPLFEGFTGGAFVVAGDLNHDGKADLAVTPDQGGGPRVTLLNGPDGKVLANFFGIDDPNFRGGARAAIGDINGDHIDDIVVSAGFGGGPRIAGYDGTTLFNGSQPTHLFHDFFLFEDVLRNGAYVAIGDLNDDGFGDIIGGAGPGGGPRVLALSGKDLVNNTAVVPLANFFSGDDGLRGGVRVTAKDEDGDGHADLVTGSGGSGDSFEYSGDALLGGSLAPSRSLQLTGEVDGIYVG